MRIRNTSHQDTSPQIETGRRNGQLCPRCHRFGTFAPTAMAGDRCTGTLSLIFTVTVAIGGGNR